MMEQGRSAGPAIIARNWRFGGWAIIRRIFFEPYGRGGTWPRSAAPELDL